MSERQHSQLDTKLDPNNAVRSKRPPPPLNARPAPSPSLDGKKAPSGSLDRRTPAATATTQPKPSQPNRPANRTTSGKATSRKVVSAADDLDDTENNTDDVGDVGYGRPPRQHRFKDGEVHNPYGRRGKSSASDEETLLEVILAELGQSIKVTEGSKSKRMRKMRAFGKRLVGGALKGEIQATKHVISLLSNQALRSAIGGSLQPQERELTLADEDIIEQFRQRCIEDHKLGTTAK